MSSFEITYRTSLGVNGICLLARDRRDALNRWLEIDWEMAHVWGSPRWAFVSIEEF